MTTDTIKNEATAPAPASSPTDIKAYAASLKVPDIAVGRPAGTTGGAGVLRGQGGLVGLGEVQQHGAKHGGPRVRRLVRQHHHQDGLHAARPLRRPRVRLLVLAFAVAYGVLFYRHR